MFSKNCKDHVIGWGVVDRNLKLASKEPSCDFNSRLKSLMNNIIKIFEMHKDFPWKCQLETCIQDGHLWTRIAWASQEC